jgi:DNA-binding transcriptional ArsR family regulator
MFNALAHPLRRQILRRMIKQRREISPRELAADLSEPLSALSYHVRVLAECEAIKLTRTKQVRGSTQHLYRPAIRLKWARLALKAPERPPKKKRRRGEENR